MTDPIYEKTLELQRLLQEHACVVCGKQAKPVFPKLAGGLIYGETDELSKCMIRIVPGCECHLREAATDSPDANPVNQDPSRATVHE